MTSDIGQDAQWADFAARHNAGDIVTVTVEKPTPFGAIVELDGVSGLLRQDGALASGATVTGRIEGIDSGKQRFSLLPV